MTPRESVHGTRAYRDLPALTLGVGLVVMAIVTDPGDHPRWLYAALAVLTSMFLLVRRQLPLVCLVGVIGCSWLRLLQGSSDNAAFVHWLAVLLAVYSAGAFTSRRDAIAAAGVVLVAFLPLVPDHPASEAVSSYLIYGVALGIGRLVRQRTARAADAVKRAVSAESERDTHALLVVAQERARVARELHDIVAHHISVIVIQAQAGQRMVDPARGGAGEVLKAIESTGRDALVELRRLLDVLRRTDENPQIQPQPGLAQLPALVDNAREAGLPIDLSIEGTPLTLPTGLDLSAFRICQEAVTNALRHSGGSRTDVLVRYLSDAVELEITDDGLGTAGQERTQGLGHGLLGMRERAAVFGGELTAGPRTPHGFTVRARLPL